MYRNNDSYKSNGRSGTAKTLSALALLGYGALIGYVTAPLLKPVPTEKPVMVVERPIMMENQGMCDFSINNRVLDYTLFTDVDYNGTWDVAERVRSIPGTDVSRTFYVTEGFGGGQSSQYDVRMVSRDVLNSLDCLQSK